MFETLDVDLRLVNCIDDERSHKLKTTYQKYNIELSEDEVGLMVKQDWLQKIASDDIPRLMSPVRYHYWKFLRGTKLRKSVIPKRDLHKKISALCAIIYFGTSVTYVFSVVFVIRSSL